MTDHDSKAIERVAQLIENQPDNMLAVLYESNETGAMRTTGIVVSDIRTLLALAKPSTTPDVVLEAAIPTIILEAVTHADKTNDFLVRVNTAHLRTLLDLLAKPSTTPDVAELIERLRAVESASPDFLGDYEGRCVTCYHRNPDGPAAADALASLSAQLAVKDAALVTSIAALGRVSVRAMDRPESPLKPIGDIAREALQEVCRQVGGDEYDRLAALSPQADVTLGDK